MREEKRFSGVLSETKPTQSAEGELDSRWHKVLRRRFFLQGIGGVAATGAALPAARLFAKDKKLSKGDAALLRFAAAAEFIESDLWQQYNELGGAVDANDNPNSGNPAYIAALENLDGDMPQYISDNTDDEISHRDFLNMYLQSKGAQPVDFTQFETLPPTMVVGANQSKGRLTNLQTLTVDTSWYFRYRSTLNPDLGASFPQLINIVKQPAIPLVDNNAQSTIQAIANIASIHFAFIEQGGSSLYPILALKANDVEVLRILLSIGGVEIDHFAIWHDKMGNAFADPLAPLSDPGTGLTFLNFNDPANQQGNSQMFQTNLIMPEPCQFLSPNLPACSIIRPTLSQNGGPMAAAQGFVNDRLFVGQAPAFFEALMDLASDAEAAKRDGGGD